jgi:hypothetical protein
MEIKVWQDFYGIGADWFSYASGPACQVSGWGVMFLDCAVEAKAQRCGLHPPEARATDVVGFGSRRETTSQKGPERGPSWQNLDNQRSLGTDAFAASDRVTFQD